MTNTVIAGLMAEAGPAVPVCGAEVKGAKKAAGKETKEERDARMGWWREAKFGMFIHWGLYSLPGGVHEGKKSVKRPGSWADGEWMMHTLKIPVDVYAKYAERFNPVKYDASEWVKIAKNAGMKYIVITTKHCEGFAMFKTQASPFNIVDATPYGKDPLKDLAEACRKEGIKLGFYYAQAEDWHHPGGWAWNGHWDKKQDGSMDEYIDKIAVPQVREILSNYGEFPQILWWDSPAGMEDGNGEKNAKKLYDAMIELKPHIISNNRLGGGFAGDTETPEQHIPPQGYPDRDWETCMTMNHTWGYKSFDNEWKSTEQLIRNLCDVASKGGNYLLNVGPTGEGLIPQPSIDRLAEIGRWMKVNGEAIYGTGPTAFGDECGAYSETKKDNAGKPAFEAKWDWRCTSKPASAGSAGSPQAGSGHGGRLYFHLFTWPGETFEVSKMKGRANKAYMLADEKATGLKIRQEGDKLTVFLPAEAPDKIASVLCVELE